VHADDGGYKPQNWMTPPTAIEQRGDPLETIVVRKVKVRSASRSVADVVRT
jgi:RecB family endonuclease NucS